MTGKSKIAQISDRGQVFLEDMNRIVAEYCDSIPFKYDSPEYYLAIRELNAIMANKLGMMLVALRPENAQKGFQEIQENIIYGNREGALLVMQDMARRKKDKPNG